MKYQYVVILKKTGQRAAELFSVLLCLLSIGFFGYAGFLLSGGIILSVIAFVLLIGLTGVWIFRRRMSAVKARYRYLLLLAALGWMLTAAPWIGLLFVVLAILEYQTRRPLEIGFDNDRVVINTLIRQRFTWEDFSNVILKDGLLTLDFKSNRLIQREVTEDDEDDDADEEEFNSWCRLRLAEK